MPIKEEGVRYYWKEVKQKNLASVSSTFFNIHESNVYDIGFMITLANGHDNTPHHGMTGSALKKRIRSKVLLDWSSLSVRTTSMTLKI